MFAFISIISVKAADVDEVSVHIINDSSEYITIYDSSGSEVTSFYDYEKTINLKIGEEYKAVYYSGCGEQESYFTPSLEKNEWDTGFYYCWGGDASFTDYYLNISKVWEDNDDAMHKRPESIKVRVVCDIYYDDEVVLSEDNGWENSIYIGNFDTSYNIMCSVTELDDLKYYERKDENDSVYVDGYSYAYIELVNEYVGPTIENTEIEIQKIWEDENNKKDIRPESVTFLLKANDSVIQEIELNDENEWKVVISVPKTDEEGNDIEYTIDEKEVPDGYEKKIDGFTITNKLIEEPLEEEKEPEEPVNPPANPNTGDSISKGSILFIGSLGILSYLLNRKKFFVK